MAQKKKPAAQTHVALKKAIKNYNAKIDRIAKREANFREEDKTPLPPRRYYSETIKNVENSSDYMKALNEIKRFNKKFAEKTYETKDKKKVTRYELDNALRNMDLTNQARKKRYEEVIKLTKHSRGEDLGQALKNEALTGLKQKDFKGIGNIYYDEFKEFSRAMAKQGDRRYMEKGDAAWLEHYIDQLQLKLGMNENTDTVKQIRALYEANPKAVVDALYDEEVAEIDFVYDTKDFANDRETYDNRVSSIQDFWEDLYNDVFDDEESA